MKNSAKSRISEYAKRADELLSAALSNDSEIFECMRYSVSAGGKRLRPAIMLLFCELVGGDASAAEPFAAALEMIHTYSLIHDDLPCMDDDDMRRGKPTNHKVYGEGMATLAGDALLGFAFETALSADCAPEIKAEAARLLAYYSGVFGMLGGQVTDIMQSAKDTASLAKMYEQKTSALLMAAAEIGVLVGGGDASKRSAAAEYAKNLGVAFQICDDILDVCASTQTLGKTAHSDDENGKTTFVTLLGVDGAKEAARQYTERALVSADAFENSEILRELAAMLLDRNK